VKKKLITVIVIVTSISFLGIIFTQLYWVKKAVDLKEEQFKTSIITALKSVENQLIAYLNDSTWRQMKSQGPDCIIEKTNIRDLINPSYLDSLMGVEMHCMTKRRDFEYAVTNLNAKRFVMGKYANSENELLTSEYKVSLKPLYKAGDYWLVTYFPNQKSRILSQMLVWLVLSALFLLVVMFTFAFTIYSFIRQKKLSEMKTDFVNNMTHEFKTPIATISLASEMLLKPNVYESPEKTKKYAHVIYDENYRLQTQVERVLQIAILDKGDGQIRQKEIDVNKLISEIFANFSLLVSKRGGKLMFKPDQNARTVFADKIHLANIVSNLLDNANKYSPEAPMIELETHNYKEGVKISVSDKGIGISNENQKHVFKKLYRVPTGNLHDVKGFGLGLYYVKTMIDEHGGTIKLTSEIGKGSKFEIYLPRFIKNNSNEEK
jgi:two-component system, OmpR family, phosphate regulon sensor histidine kinase PhoR